MKELTSQQKGLLEQYSKASTAWLMAVNIEEDIDLGTAWMSALDACKAAGFDPFHYPQPQ